MGVVLSLILDLQIVCFQLSLNESNDNAFLMLTGISFHNFAPLKVIDFCVNSDHIQAKIHFLKQLTLFDINVGVVLSLILDLQIVCFQLSLNESNDNAFLMLSRILFHNFAPLKVINFCVKIRSYLGKNTFPETADFV